MEDVRSWHGKINWFEKARLYKIRSKGQDMTTPNGGQMLSDVFLQSKDVDISHFNPSTQVNEHDPQYKFQGFMIMCSCRFSHIFFKYSNILYLY